MPSIRIIPTRSQGLTGGAAVTLTGGDSSSPPVTAENGQLPLLSAEPGAGQDWQSLGREELRKHDNILTDNADKLHSAIANFKIWRILHTDYRRPLSTFKTAFTALRSLIFFTQSFE